MLPGKQSDEFGLKRIVGQTYIKKSNKKIIYNNSNIRSIMIYSSGRDGGKRSTHNTEGVQGFEAEN